MGVCYSDLSPATLSFHAIKREKKLLLLGLTPEFEENVIQKLQSTKNSKPYEGYYITSEYNFGSLRIKESTPYNLPWNSMHIVDDETYGKLIKFWDVINYDILLQGWFRQNYSDLFPKDIVTFMKTFCCIPPVNVDSFKMKGSNDPNKVYNILNVSNIYRKCWSLSNNKECFRHKELMYCFKQSKATLFAVDLSSYDTNRMNRTIKLYQWFLKDYSLYLNKSRVKYGNVVVIFDNIQEFKDKLANNIAISQCSAFVKYNGNNDYEACREFIEFRFRALNLYSTIKLRLHFGIENNQQKIINQI